MSGFENLPVKVIRDLSEDTQPVTAVISQQVKPDRMNDYEQWIKDISTVAQQFPGHSGVSIVRPDAGICTEYVVILKFDRYANLHRWLTSEERKHWIEKAEPFVVKIQEVKILTGLETWFTLPYRSQKPPPRHKMVALTTIAVFGCVNLLNPILLPFLTAFLPQLVSSLIVTFLVVLLLTYGVMPRLTKLFSGWLYPTPDRYS